MEYTRKVRVALHRIRRAARQKRCEDADGS